METAAKVLVVGGVANLLYGFATGVPFMVVRSRGPDVSRYLRNAHVGPLMQGPMLLGLVLAAQLSTLSPSLETLAAWLVVAGSAALGLGDTLLWLYRVDDAFRERRGPGVLLAGAATLLSPAGVAILLAGAVQGL